MIELNHLLLRTVELIELDCVGEDDQINYYDEGSCHSILLMDIFETMSETGLLTPLGTFHLVNTKYLESYCGCPRNNDYSKEPCMVLKFKKSGFRSIYFMGMDEYKEAVKTLKKLGVKEDAPEECHNCESMLCDF